jgi:hypothetical protein
MSTATDFRDGLNTFNRQLSDGTNTPQRNFGDTKFNVNVLRYPTDFDSLQHYIRIDISETTTQAPPQNRVAGSANLNAESRGTAARGLLIAGSAAAGAGIGGGFGGRGGAILGGLGGAGVGAAAATGDIFQTRGTTPVTTRLDSSVLFHLINPPSVKYSMQYSNKELGTLAGIAGGVIEALSGGQSLQDTISNLVSTGGEAGQALVLNLANLPGQLSGLADIRGAVSAATRTSINPFKEVLFEAVNFRTFNFSTRFMPVSRSEADNVKKIIDTFKKYMHPTLSENKLFFIYPADFEITYMFNGSTNPYFHRIAPCALTDMDVTYGGDIMSSFKDGVPTEINLTLQFTEKEILTQDSMDAGF